MHLFILKKSRCKTHCTVYKILHSNHGAVCAPFIVYAEICNLFLARNQYLRQFRNIGFLINLDFTTKRNGTELENEEEKEKKTNHFHRLMNADRHRNTTYTHGSCALNILDEKKIWMKIENRRWWQRCEDKLFRWIFSSAQYSASLMRKQIFNWIYI